MTNNLIKIIIGGIIAIILTAGGILFYNYVNKQQTNITPLTQDEIDDLQQAILDGDIASYKKYINDGARLSFAFEDKTTPLEKVIEAGDFSSAIQIINSGFDLTKVDNNHVDTVANILVYNKQWNIEEVSEVAKILVEQIKGEIENEGTKGYSLLMSAVYANNEVLVEEILKHITDINKEYTPKLNGVPVEDNVQTALYYACENSANVEIIRMLIEKGADVNYQGREGYNCLMNAIYLNQNNVVEYLVTLPELDINMQNEYGQTVLHVCVEYSNSEAIDIIRQNKNVNKDITDNDGFTAKSYAEYLDMGNEFTDKL